MRDFSVPHLPDLSNWVSFSIGFVSCFSLSYHIIRREGFILAGVGRFSDNIFPFKDCSYLPLAFLIQKSWIGSDLYGSVYPLPSFSVP